LLPGSQLAIFSPCPHMAGRGRKLSGVPFIKALIPFVRAAPSRPKHLPKVPRPNTIPLGVRVSTYKFGEDTNIQYGSIVYSFAGKTWPRVSPMPCFAFVFCTFVFLYFHQRNKTNRPYSSPPLSVKDMFQDPQWMPETTDSTRPYIYYAFFPKYTYL